ncbi:uncharacterized protein JCM6883_005723 [Sporobolomyces salmoneus]|uniref:uncharacterized protein n=1 Tax=Sporobolomyces salmoneus TaxID=183962 RepID=UPI00316DEA46
MNPLSGSNRVPLSPRRASLHLPISTSTSTLTTSTTSRGGYTPPFPVPPYLRHSSYYPRFYTTPNPLQSDDESTLQDNSIYLPTHWDEGDKCALLELTTDGLVASFAGSAKYGDRDAAAVRANRPIPTETGMYYFEVEVLNKGLSGYIGVGLSHRSVSLSRLPGWEQLSYGYHADDGRAFCCQGTGEPFGPTFSTGDVVGCGIDWTDAGGERGKKERDGSKKGKEKSKEKGSGRVFYTKNGIFLGYAFSNLSGNLYPTIGLRTPNESVRVNFGQAPFKFDIESLLLDRKRTILSRINDTSSLPPHYYLPLSQSPSPPIPTLSTSAQASSSSSKERDRLHETLQSLIGGYLKHCGYDDTARAFERQVKRERQDRGEGILNPGSTTEDSREHSEAGGEVMEEAGRLEGGGGGASSAELRSKILNLAITDRTKEALELVQEHYPSVLEEGEVKQEEEEELIFKLKCRVFVEAVLAYSQAENSVPTTTTTMKGKGKSDSLVEEDDTDVDMSSSFVSTSSPISIDGLLDLGRSLHSSYSSHPSPSIQSELQATLGLMAYRNPEKEAAEGKARRIVKGEEKERVVERLNRAILKASNLPPQPTLELMFRHAIATVEYAAESGSGGAALVDVKKEVLGE